MRIRRFVVLVVSVVSLAFVGACNEDEDGGGAESGTTSSVDSGAQGSSASGTTPATGPGSAAGTSQTAGTTGTGGMPGTSGTPGTPGSSATVAVSTIPGTTSAGMTSAGSASIGSSDLALIEGLCAAECAQEELCFGDDSDEFEFSDFDCEAECVEDWVEDLLGEDYPEACFAAEVAAAQCTNALNCEELEEWFDEVGDDYPCAAEDAAADAACGFDFD